MQGKIKSLVRLMHFLMKLRRFALQSRVIRANEWAVPRDVEEGHFAVMACKGEEKKRFVVGLRHLQKPGFLRLLDMARDEYGFRSDGLLVVPCLPDELEKILEDEEEGQH